jgi:regulator of sigma E protease
MNLVLAVGLLTGLYMHGREVPAYWYQSPVVGVVERKSPAEAAGIQPGDIITSLDGNDRPNWQDVENRIATNPKRAMAVTLDRKGQLIHTTLKPVSEVQDSAVGPTEVGVAGICPHIPVVVKKVWTSGDTPVTLAEYPGEQAGLKAGDEITAVNGIPLNSSCRSIQEAIKDTSEKTFPITILRNGQSVEVEVTPTVAEGRRLIGMDIPYPTSVVKRGFGEAVAHSVETNVEQATLMFQVIARLFKREASLDQLAGPIGIMRVSGQAYELGFGALISLMAFISLNLGVLNALPIPVLDGGVMLLILVESVMRRDLSLRVKERIVQVGVVFLLVLTVFVLYNDIVKLFPPRPPAP